MSELKEKAVKVGGKVAESRVFRVLHMVQQLYGEVEVSVRAGSFAYYALFSIFPLLALMLTIGSLFFSQEEITKTLLEVAPPGGQVKEIIEQTFEQFRRARPGVSIISIFIFLWASLRFFQSLVRAVNRAWHSDALPWWHVPLKNLAMVAVMASALVFGMFAPAIIQGVQRFSVEHLPDALEHAIQLALHVARLGLGTVVLFYAFTMLYMVSPRNRVPFKDVWFASLSVTLVLQGLQMAFVGLVPKLVNYSAIYGTVGTLMLLMMWLYLSGTVVIVGACVSVAIKRTAPDAEADDYSGDDLQELASDARQESPEGTQDAPPTSKA